MRTPREMLFARHRQAEPKLDAVRQRALAALQAPAPRPAAAPRHRAGQWLGTMLRTAWWELIWPARRAWAGLAVLWLAVLGANLEMNATSPGVPAGRSTPPRELARAFEEQRRVLAELLPAAQTPPPPTVHPPQPADRPRSERSATSKAV